MADDATHPEAPSTSLGSTVIRVVVADDAFFVREGVQRVLEPYDDVEIVASAGDLVELLAAVDEHRPDVVVTDIRMPPTSTNEGIQAASRLRENFPNTGVVVLSQYAEPPYALELLAGGSERRAYLLKERISEPDQLADAIREVNAGGSVVDPRVVELLVTAVRKDKDPLARLTTREREVLAQIAQGKSNAGVAEALTLSERAVEKHINSLFAKLGLFPATEMHRRVTAVLLYLDSLRT